MACNWIVLHDGTKGDDAYSCWCMRCGAKQRFILPISIKYWCLVAKAFLADHQYCEAAEAAKDK